MSMTTMMPHMGGMDQMGNHSTSMPGGHDGVMPGTHGDGMTHVDVGMGPMGHGMQMYFTTEWVNKHVLFEEWLLKDLWHLIVSCVAVFILAALYEGLKVGREVLLHRYNERASGQKNVYQANIDAGSGQMNGTVCSRLCSGMHFLQTILHMVQVAISYFLMLVVMTYNIFLCASIVLGAGVGYFLFGWKRAVIVDVNEHCH